jgi:hypothetical protein
MERLKHDGGSSSPRLGGATDPPHEENSDVYKRWHEGGLGGISSIGHPTPPHPSQHSLAAEAHAAADQENFVSPGKSPSEMWGVPGGQPTGAEPAFHSQPSGNSDRFPQRGFAREVDPSSERSHDIDGSGEDDVCTSDDSDTDDLIGDGVFLKNYAEHCRALFHCGLIRENPYGRPHPQ